MPGKEGSVYIGVIGAGGCSGEIYETARRVGEEIACRGAVLVCGGLGGVMEAACQGAKERGGTTIGILPGDDRAEANPWVDVAVPSGMGVARNILVVRSSDVVIAVDGAYGTLSEIALALNTGVKVVGLNTWMLKKAEKDNAEHIVRAENPRDAVEKALALAVKSK